MNFDSSKLADPVSIFKAASEQFRASLSDKQLRLFKEYPDAKTMLMSIQDQVGKHPIQTSVLTRCCQKILALSTKLSPFFEVISLFVSSHPEFAALAWGSLRLVFVLGSNHVLFLERVCQLFQDMGMKLPAYEEFLESLNAAQGRRPVRSPTRLLRAMAYIYADLVQFCFDMCQVFSRKRSKFLSLRGSFIRSLPTTVFSPFNVKYDTLLKRWDQHQQLIQLEMAVITSVEQMDATGRIELMLNKFIEEGGFEDESTKQARRDPAQTKLHLQAWINPPPWLSLFESAQDQRASESTGWFVRHDLVTRWIPEEPELEQSSFRVLSVQGKPGYGKTTLCTTLIEHIWKQTSSSSIGWQGHRTALAFFYFDKQRPDSVSSSAAWRAILMQLLHSMSPSDPDIFDIFLLLRENPRAGQPTASDNEIFSILHLIVQRLDRLFLVFDGVDECLDQRHFLDRLTAICNLPGDALVALFSRPTVILPASLLPNTAVLTLDSTLNLQDIAAFIRLRMASHFDDGLLPPSLHLEDAVTLVADRANGMFLWATLFMDYLQSPHLSIRERREALENLTRLEGLDSLYKAILDSLKKSAFGNARTNIIQAFRLVVCSFRPLHITELQYSIAIPMDRSVDSDDLIPNFSQKLGLLSGALLELDQNQCVRFVHLSVIEYLTNSTDLSSGNDASLEITVDMQGSHRSFACRCLSYLHYSVEANPLAGSPRIIPDPEVQGRRYPLLDYASEFWSFHVLQCLEDLTSSPIGQDFTLLVGLASKFLSSKRSVMVWIEASWMFKRPPQIRHGLHDAFFQKHPQAPSQHDRQLKSGLETAWTALLQLCRDLSDMKNSWAHILMEEPNEIWEPSVSVFNQSPFWQRISGANIAARFEARPDGDHQSICLKTQLSHDGCRLGLIRLYASLRDGRITVFFELWSIDPNIKLREVDLRIPGSCLKPFFQTNQTRPGELSPLEALRDGFQFPATITADLQRTAVPGCVVHIPAPESDQPEFITDHNIDESTQFIDITGNAWRHGPFSFGIEDFQLNYDIQLSGTGEYLMTVHKSNGIVDLRRDLGCQLRLVTIYQDAATRSFTRPSYRHVASLAFKPMFLHHNDRDANWCALLHPRYPIVAIKYQRIIVHRDAQNRSQVMEHVEDTLGEGPGAALWSFGETGHKSLRFSKFCPERLAFDHDGEYFCGMPVNAEEPRSGTRHYKNAVCPNKTHQPGGSISHPKWQVDLPYLASRPALHNLGELSSYVDESGDHSISQLKDSGNGGVVLATLRKDGLIEAEMVTRLPESISGDYSASVLNNTAAGEKGPQTRRLFLSQANRPFKRHYIQMAEQETKDPAAQLPFVLHRQRETIPMVVGQGQYVVGRGLGFEEKQQMRLEWPGAEREVKRRDMKEYSPPLSDA